MSDPFATRICRIASCPMIARGGRGPTAPFCEYHGKEEMRRRAALRVQTQARKRVGMPDATADLDGDALVSSARSVLSATKDLRAAITAVYKAESRKADAIVRWKAAIAKLIQEGSTTI